MLDLYLAFHEGRTINVWSLCLAANIPTSTAHRRIGELIEDGVFRRGPDGGRVMVSLTREYIEKLDQLFDDLAAAFGADGTNHQAPFGQSI